MATISCTILNNFPSKLPLNLPKPTPLNNNPLHFHNHGSSFSSRNSKLSVKINDFQDPLRINEIGKETSINLFQCIRMIEGCDESKEMTRKNLIWATSRMQVAVNSYPSWGDIVQVETWCSALGEYGPTCSSRLTNYKTGKKIMRVDTEFTMINQNTRTMSKIPGKLRTKLKPFVRENFDPLTIDNKHGRLWKLDANCADNIVKGIKPLWFDLDLNQHVINFKYINWILEGTPKSVRKNNELAEITVEFRRECGGDNVLNSLSTTSTENPLEFDHLLCLEDGKEVARSSTLWRSRK